MNFSAPSQRIRIGCWKQLPYSIGCCMPDSDFKPSDCLRQTIKRPGFAVDLIELIVQRALYHLNGTMGYSIVVNPDNSGGHMRENGSWTGAIGGLLTNKWDVVLPVLTMSYDRSKFIEFVQPVIVYVPQKFLIHVTPEPEVSVSLIKPYQNIVWALWMLSLLAATVFLRSKYPKKSWPEAVGRSAFELLFQKRDNRARRWSSNTQAAILVSAWSIAVFFAVAFYKSFFVQQLTPQHRYRPPFADTFELANLMRAGHYQFLCSQNSWRTSKLFRWGPGYGWDALREAVQSNPEAVRMFKSETAAFRHLLRNHGSVISADGQMVNWLMSWPEGRHSRLVSISDWSSPAVKLATAVRKDFQWKEMINREIANVARLGFLEYLERKYPSMQQNEEYKIKIEEQEKWRPLTIEQGTII